MRVLRLPDGHPASLRFLRSAVPRSYPAFAPVSPRIRGRPARDLRLAPGYPTPLDSVEPSGPPKFLRDPQCLFAHAPATPAEPPTTRHHAAATRPPVRERQGLPQGTFEAQSHRFRTRCLRFAGRVAPTPRKTRFQVLARLSWVGSFHRVSPKVSATHLIRILLPRLLGAIPFEFPGDQIAV